MVGCSGKQEVYKIKEISSYDETGYAVFKCSVRVSEKNWLQVVYDNQSMTLCDIDTFSPSPTFILLMPHSRKDLCLH